MHSQSLFLVSTMLFVVKTEPNQLSKQIVTGIWKIEGCRWDYITYERIFKVSSKTMSSDCHLLHRNDRKPLHKISWKQDHDEIHIKNAAPKAKLQWFIWKRTITGPFKPSWIRCFMLFTAVTQSNKCIMVHFLLKWKWLV